jgi:hypothetical protein
MIDWIGFAKSFALLPWIDGGQRLDKGRGRDRGRDLSRFLVGHRVRLHIRVEILSRDRVRVAKYDLTWNSLTSRGDIVLISQIII